MTADEATSPTLPGPVALPRSVPLRPGTILDGRFRLDEVLGGGGVGVVYRARQLALGRDIAIKVLRRDMSELPELARRFEREARTLSRLSHPCIVRVDDFGLHGQVPYLVMELLCGRTLDDDLRAGPLSVRRSIAIGRQVLSALEHAHRHGVIHRDVKATNVMLLDGHGDPESVRAKVFDFGLARLAAPVREGDEITRHGTINGTPEYMSPEQVWGGIADERSDLYSVGVLLFEMLAGRLPFSGDPITLLAHHVRTPAPRLREVAPDRGIPEPLDDLVARALEKDRDLRPASALELLEALDAVARDLDSTSGSAVLRSLCHSAHSPRGTAPPPSMESCRSMPARRPAPARRAGLRLAAAFLAGPLVAVAASFLLGSTALEAGPREAPDRPSAALGASLSLRAAEAPVLSENVSETFQPPAAGHPVGAKVEKAATTRSREDRPRPATGSGPPTPRPRASRPRFRRAARLPANPY